MIHKAEKTTQKTKSTVAIIAPMRYAGVVQSVVNSARYLAMQGYSVDIFTIQDDRFPISFLEDNINIIFIQSLAIFQGSYNFISVVISILLSSPNQYSFVIGFDQTGLITSGILSSLWHIPYIYHSLEITDLEAKSSIKKRFKKILEDWFSQRALFCLSQDKQRCHILAEINGLKTANLLVVYHSPLGSKVLPEKDNYLRSKFNISNNKYIVLAVGSLQFEHCIDQIVISVDQWPDDFVLVLHGWFGIPEHEKVIRREIELRPEKVFLSTDLLDGDSKYRIFQSTDIGLVFFQPVDKNYMFGAGSAGKMFDFMRVGVPIIACDIPGMREIVEDKGVGIVVQSPKDIGRTLTKIMGDYEYLRKNSLESYSYYEFGKCYSHVLELIKGKIEEIY